ncbi:hypothetical protein B0H15DRAFT_943825 [Mycena belliarum]|uniref:Uncharacterized protein n=1 Tax=Mycena belliarum TaxID=1033014 RepID=A0AAD6UFG6_9AGAR|nr:hypothetical protein B0H15DRAFT_943825 [Mycena belliae]
MPLFSRPSSTLILFEGELQLDPTIYPQYFTADDFPSPKKPAPDPPPPKRRANRENEAPPPNPKPPRRIRAADLAAKKVKATDASYRARMHARAESTSLQRLGAGYRT